MILEAIGEDPEREGLKETPQRVARMYKEVFQGLKQDPADHLHKTFELVDGGIVIVKDIGFHSMCEHHLLPFWGKAHIAYIPKDRVAGLSKLARTVEVFARRPQLQERITKQVAEAIMKELDAEGVLVVTEAEHMCMNMRGVKKPGSSTRSAISYGSIAEDLELKTEAYRLMGL